MFCIFRELRSRDRRQKGGGVTSLLFLPDTAHSPSRGQGLGQPCSAARHPVQLHTVLPTQCCPHRAAHTALPTLHCPHSAAHTALPTQRCPHSAAHTALPTLHCPHSTAHTALPTQRCPHSAAHMALPTLCHPHHTAHTALCRVLRGLEVLAPGPCLRGLAVLEDIKVIPVGPFTYSS